MGYKVILERRFKPWLNAPENTYERIVESIFKLFSRRKIQARFKQDSQTSVPSLYFGLRYGFLSYLAEALTAAAVFFRRSTAGTKYGFLLVFVPVNSAGLYYLLFIQFSSNFNYGLQLYEQFFLIANWTLLEIVTLKVALSLKYEKGLIQLGKLQPINVEIGAGIFGLFLSLPLVILSFIISIEKVTSLGIIVFLQLLISLSLNFCLGIILGVLLSRMTNKRDLKFIIPVFFKISFLFSPMFNRLTETPGFFTYFSEISIFNSSLKITSIGYSTSYIQEYYLVLIYLMQVIFIALLIGVKKKKVHLERPNLNAIWSESS
jgi:hypothetical protein